MKRKSHIDAILTKADLQLRSIVSEYESSLHKQQVEVSLQVDIKNYCENLRSPRKKTRVAAGVRERRLQIKKRRSQLKTSRGGKDW